MAAKRSMPSRNPQRRLTRQRVLKKAVAIADGGGIESVTMRRLAAELDVEAMSLYNHVGNKDDLLNGMVDSIFAEIEVPIGKDWRTAMRERAISARKVLLRHSWAVALLDSRTSPGTATLRHHDAVIGILRKGGFSVELTAHAYALLDSFVYGFVLQETALQFNEAEELADVADTVLKRASLDEHPHLVELTTRHILKPGYDFADAFPFGLDLILDGLERSRGKVAGSHRKAGTDDRG